MIARKAGPVRSVLALVSGFLLAGATQPAFGKRLGPFHDCAGMCSLEFMKGASSDTITAGLSNNPAARRYLRDMLWFAVKVDNAGAVEALLRAGAPPNSLEYYSNGRFLLQVAAARGNKRIVSLLLTAGAFPNAAGPEGGRPLHAAAGFGRVDVVAALLAAGADLRASDRHGMTIVRFVKRKDKFWILMNWGWFIGDLDPLLPPRCRKCRDRVLVLLRAPPPVPSCGELCTPEFWKTADEKRVRRALARVPAGARLSAPGGGPLHLAIAAGADLALVKLLLDHGLDPNGRDIGDDTPLHVAARTPGSVAAIVLLLRRGAILEVRNTWDGTPLLAAEGRASTRSNKRALLEAAPLPDKTDNEELYRR